MQAGEIFEKRLGGPGPHEVKSPISPHTQLAARPRGFILFILCALFSSNISGAVPNQLTPEETAAGWRLLFDGKTTQGWRGFGKPGFPSQGWIVADGELRLQAGSKAGDIITVDKFRDFDLTWEWKLPRGANNGLKYFILEERGQPIGHEYQMIDDVAGHDSGPKHSTASFYDVLPPAADKPLQPPGEWNLSRVLVQGQRVEHWLNGRKVLEYTLGSESVLAAVQASKFKSVPGFGTKVEGHILLTYHHDPVAYRNIKIRVQP